MQREKASEVNKVLNEIQKEETEIKILENRKFLFLKTYVSAFSKVICEVNEMDLSEEDLQTLIDFRKRKIEKLEKRLEEL